MQIGVCLKHVDLRPEVDPLTGAVHSDERSSGASHADLAALEWALQAAEAWGGAVLAVTAGRRAAQAVLHEALAAGAGRARRVDLDPDAPSEVVATALSDALEGCDMIWCGDASADRGSGSVPAYLAAARQAAQALGLVHVEIGEPGTVLATRRLDGGRRELLRVDAPAVLSVEGSTARLRRAPVAPSIAALARVIDVVPGPPLAVHAPRVTRPFRPRARELAPPSGGTALERIVALTDAHAGPGNATGAVAMEPDDAAERILDSLREWGYHL